MQERKSANGVRLTIESQGRRLHAFIPRGQLLVLLSVLLVLAIGSTYESWRSLSKTIALHEQEEAVLLAPVATAQRQDLMAQIQERKKELRGLEEKYSALLPIVEGQEALATSYRDLLRERSIGEWCVDQLSGFSIGVLSSLFVLWLGWLMRAEREGKEPGT